VDGGGWISDLAFTWTLLPKSSAHYDVWQLRLCESQLKLRNYVHFRHLKSLQSVSPLRKQEHSRSLFLGGGVGYERSSTNSSKTPKFGIEICLLFLSRQTVSRVPPILKIDLIDLQRDINLTQSFMSNDLKYFSAYWPKKKSSTQNFWTKNDCNVRQQVYVRTFSPLQTMRRKALNKFQNYPPRSAQYGFEAPDLAY